jgi:acylphosphatase
MDEPVRVRLVASGRVQGVGFRRYVERCARRLDLTGWVRNLKDGAVEIVVEGPEASVTALRADVEQGPPGARVQEVSAAPLDGATALPRPFAVLH